jgi:hypothetical protein
MAIPALPDEQRATFYDLTAQTGPFDVDFALYSDGVDYENWIEVRLDGELLEPGDDWTLDSPSGNLSSLRRPITDARVTLTVASTGELQIFGQASPRRLLQVAENQGVSAEDFNRIVTSIIAMQREAWDRYFTATLRVPLGEVDDVELPNAADRADSVVGFDEDGLITLYTPDQNITQAVRYDVNQTLTQVQMERAKRNIGIQRTYTPYDFGAVGDGVADDTDAIQDWLDEGGEGVALVGAGVFRVTETIIVDNPYTTIMASGYFKIFDADTSQTNTMQVQNAATDFWMEGVEVDYNKAVKGLDSGDTGTLDNTYCLSVRGTRPTLINCIFRNSIEHCVSIRKMDATAGDLLERPRIINCTAIASGNQYSNRGYGFWVFGNIRNSFVWGCTTEDCLGGGIGIDELSSGSPAGNHHYNCIVSGNHVHAGGGAIRYEGSQFAAIVGNVIDNYFNTGASEQHAAIVARSIQQTGQINPAGDVAIIGNYLYSPLCLIDMQNPQDVIISGNVGQLTNAAEGAITELAMVKCFKNNSTYTPRQVLIQNNLFKGNVRGIVFGKYQTGTPTTMPGVVISGNTLLWTGGSAAPSDFNGIDIDYLAAPIVHDNVMRGFYRGLYFHDNATGPLICTDNKAFASVQYGFHFGVDCEKIITGNYSKDAVTADFRFEDSARDNAATVYRDNHLTTTSNAPNSNVQPDRLNKNVEGQVVTGGAEVTTKDLGAITTGTVTPDPSARAKQKYTNGGAHTLAPSAKHGSYTVDIENVSGAGAITDSGFTKRSGDPFTTTVGHKFRCYVDIGAHGSSLVREQLV